MKVMICTIEGSETIMLSCVEFFIRTHTSCPATLPTFLRVNPTFTTDSCSLHVFKKDPKYKGAEKTHEESMEEPGPLGISPAVDPEIDRSE